MDRSDPHGSYRGDWDGEGRARLTWVPPDGRPPQPVEHLVKHSPDGLAWGYAGSGPADAALSIVTRATGDREIAESVHHHFKREHIARLAINEPFTLAGTDVAVWLQTRGIEPAIGVSAVQLDAQATDLAARELAIEARARELDQFQARLEARAAAIRQAIDVDPLWELPAAPVANQIRWLVKGTGDPIELVAKGLDLEPGYAAGLVDGSIAEIDLDHVQRLCEALHCSPYDLWGAEDARKILHAYGPELWPRFIEPLEPPDLESPERPHGLGPTDPPRHSGPILGL